LNLKEHKEAKVCKGGHGGRCQSYLADDGMESRLTTTSFLQLLCILLFFAVNWFFLRSLRLGGG